MGAFKAAKSTVRIELISANLTRSLQIINDMRVPIFDLQITDELVAHFTMPYRCLGSMQAVLTRKGETVKVLSHQGPYSTFHKLKHRWLLWIGVVLLFTFALFLPTRVLFITVEGNESVPSNLILETAKEAGIHFFASRRMVRSEKMKNELLGALPQLQWAGINTNGCNAVITVKERRTEKSSRESSGISRIIAVRDGVITSCTVTGGSGACTVGQAVRKGQVLISGYTECGGVVIGGRASGEIYAQTCHEICSVTPLENKIRTQNKQKRTLYCLRIGKKRINFYKGSGIYDSSCVKMVSEYDLALPGGCVLPLTLVKETYVLYALQDNVLEESALTPKLSEFSKATLCRSALALSIIDTTESTEASAGVMRMMALYDCTEMIGREQSEQIGDFYGKTG